MLVMGTEQQLLPDQCLPIRFNFIERDLWWPHLSIMRVTLYVMSNSNNKLLIDNRVVLVILINSAYSFLTFDTPKVKQPTKKEILKNSAYQGSLESRDKWISCNSPPPHKIRIIYAQ